MHKKYPINCNNTPTTGDTTATACTTFNWYGTDYTTSGDKTHTLTNSAGCDSVVTLHLTIITSCNNPPIVANEIYTGKENSIITGNITSNDIDADGTISVNTTPIVIPKNGAISINSNGAFVYTPNTNYFGNDTVITSVCDNNNVCINDTLVLVINPVNDAPVTTSIYAIVASGTHLPVNIATGTNDVDGDILNYTCVNPVGVSVTTNITGNGTLVIAPTNASDTGIVSIRFTVCDNGVPSLCDSGVIVVHYVSDSVLRTTNYAPIAVNDLASTMPNVPVNVNVKGNDSDPNGNNTLGNPAIVKTAVNGTAAVNADRTITYTPNTGFVGNDTLAYAICDNGTPSLCDTALVVVTVTGNIVVNRASVATDDYASVNEDGTITIAVKNNDSDPDGNTLSSPSIITQTSYGTSVVNIDGMIVYKPNANYNVADTLVYTICDIAFPSLCDTATVVIKVLPVNDAPVITSVIATVAAGTHFPVNVAIGTQDIDGDVLSYTYSTPVGIPATTNVTGNGALVIAPTNPADTGMVSINFTVCDNGIPSLCDSGIITINFVSDSVLQSTNFAPIAVDDLANTTPNTSVTVNVKGNDSDPNGNNTLGTPTIIHSTTNGNSVVNSDGSITYTPNNNYVGNDTFTYTVCDNGTPSLCDTALVIVTVTSNTVANK